MGDHKWSYKQEQVQDQQSSFEMIRSSSSMRETFICKEAATYDLGDLDQALYLYLNGPDHQSSQEPIRQTLNIFPSQPMHVEPSPKSDAVSLASQTTSSSKGHPEQSMVLSNPRSHPPDFSEPKKDMRINVVKQSEVNGKGTTSSSEHEGPKTPDAKTLRRLAQNREAARKSRLRKKAYVQQLESSKIKLTQLEQELIRMRAQGLSVCGGAPVAEGISTGIGGGLSTAAVMFDMEYARWLEEHHRLLYELRAAMQEDLPENQVRVFVDNCMAHYEAMINLKSIAIKSDVFHIISGMWKTPVERCFMWIGGFRPSELIKVVLRQIEPLTEQQMLGVCGLQQLTQATEEALSQGLEALHQSLSETIIPDTLSWSSNMANYMGQMAVAMSKLSALENFVKQADNLRLQTLQRLCQILNTHQACWCFLVITDYFHRLRALSSLWLSRPRQE